MTDLCKCICIGGRNSVSSDEDSIDKKTRYLRYADGSQGCGTVESVASDRGHSLTPGLPSSSLPLVTVVEEAIVRSSRSTITRSQPPCYCEDVAADETYLAGGPVRDSVTLCGFSYM